MSGWHGTIQNDLAPLTVIPRGFGGSNMNDLLHYADRIVLRHKPRAVVVYEGDNDIALGISPETVAAKFGEFVAKVRGRLPECRIYFISIKPSIARWPLWPKMKETNSLIALQCASDKRLTFVDVASGMLNEQGEPRKSLFKNDNLHMTRDGYVIWRDALKPILLKSELEHEELDVRNGDAASFRVRNGDGSETGTQLVFSTLVYSPTVWRYRLRPEGPRRGKTGRKRPQ